MAKSYWRTHFPHNTHLFEMQCRNFNQKKFNKFDSFLIKFGIKYGFILNLIKKNTLINSLSHCFNTKPTPPTAPNLPVRAKRHCSLRNREFHRPSLFRCAAKTGRGRLRPGR